MLLTLLNLKWCFPELSRMMFRINPEPQTLTLFFRFRGKKMFWNWSRILEFRNLGTFSRRWWKKKYVSFCTLTLLWIQWPIMSGIKSSNILVILVLGHFIEKHFIHRWTFHTYKFLKLKMWLIFLRECNNMFYYVCLSKIWNIQSKECPVSS